MEDIELFENIVNDMTETYKRKNHDYGNSVSDTYNRYGMVSYLTRIRDKLNRLDTLLVYNKSSEVKEETVEDTFMDLANYCILATMELKRK